MLPGGVVVELEKKGEELCSWSEGSRSDMKHGLMVIHIFVVPAEFECALIGALADSLDADW